ncbi:uncharacterized protein J4E87_005301 [Alternaria ethzedia]|uniref:uncharacterized protein n=1 Tax=Alternaria ethzedia TaxID=181014 RepID=UPI0020C435A6|nr:uncharacterized protein J4E87_005301 [Alternaria ethzedia]KAI4624820.1 hypothetical protein J4E87_005301 [Alternaria ethzedia]
MKPCARAVRVQCPYLGAAFATQHSAFRRFEEDVFPVTAGHYPLSNIFDLARSMIETSMHFLQRSDLYSTVKPYSLRFEPPDGFERSNIKLERREDLKIEDARPNINNFTLEEQGFKIVNMESKMRYEQFEDDAKIVQVYLSEIADTIRELLGAAHVQIFEHTVRKHTTATWAADMVRRLNGDEKAEKLLKGRVQCVK